MGAAARQTATADSKFSRRRALIIKSAAHVFGRKGFHATTLEEIAAELQVTKASLYYYFSTKEELLYEVHLLSLQDVLAQLDQVQAEFSSPVDQLQRIVAGHLRVLASDYEGAFLLQQEYDLPEPYHARIVELRDRYERGLLEIVQEGVRQRLFRVKDERVAVRMILGGINWFLRWYRSSGRLTVEQIADAYVDFIFYGLLASPVAVGELQRLASGGAAAAPAGRPRPAPPLRAKRARKG